MQTATLPSPQLMFNALVTRDTSYDGAFFAAVRTTGIFCRPGCGEKPRRENVEFFATGSEALHAGYRPCLRCRPLKPSVTPPEWVDRLIARVDATPHAHLHAQDLRGLGITPERAARWFKQNWGMTFQAWQRARRVGPALRVVREGASVGSAADQSGFASESGFRAAFTRLFGAPPARAAAQDRDAVFVRWLPTPLGPMLAAANDAGICLLEFVDRRAIESQLATLRRRVPGAIVPGENAHLRQLALELARWFAGAIRDFTVPVVAPGTPFQERVWRELRRIAPATTRSYADVARAIGQPSAVRAVARANGMNRVAILIPCHRVIGSDGKPTGYAGGVWRKEWLLKHEREMAMR